METIQIIFVVLILFTGGLAYHKELRRGLATAYVKIADPRQPNLLDILDQNNIYRFYLILIFFIAVFVRLFLFGDIPVGVNQDGAMAAMDAKALGQYGTDRLGMFMPVHFTAWGYSQMSVLMSYIMVPFIKLFGLNVITLRLPTMIVSLLGMLVCFLYSRLVFNRKAALLILFVLAINPWHLMQSRWALEANLLPHFILFGLYFLYKGLKKPPYLYVSMIFFALSMYAYGIAFFAVPILLVVFCIYLYRKRLIDLKRALLSAGVYLLFAWPIFGVVIINYFKLDSLVTPLFTVPFFPESVRMQDILLFKPLNEWLSQLTANIGSLVNILLQKDDLPWNVVSGYGTIYIIGLPFFLLGFFGLRTLKKRTDDPVQKAGISLIAVWFWVAVVIVLLVNNANVNRANLLFYPMIAITGVGLWLVLDKLRKKSIAVGILAAFWIIFILFGSVYFNKDTTVRFYPGFQESVQYAEQSGQPRLYITDEAQNPATSEILTQFAAELDSKYVRGLVNAYDQNGKKLLPYTERYTFISFGSGAWFMDQKDAVYVFPAYRQDMFDPAKYAVAFFGDFGVAEMR